MAGEILSRLNLQVFIFLDILSEPSSLPRVIFPPLAVRFASWAHVTLQSLFPYFQERWARQRKMGRLLITDTSVTEIPDLPRVEVEAHRLFAAILQVLSNGLFSKAFGMKWHQVLFLVLLVIF